jgi:transcriptional regulator with XRE-family HTH domain
MTTQLDIARRCRLDVSSVNKILHRRKGPKFKKETVKAVFKAARELGYDVGGLKREHRRRDERRSTEMAVELRIYLENGKHFDLGTAILRNVSLSGALLGALVLPGKAIPVEPYMLGFRTLDGPLKDVEIVGRPIRLVHSKAGVEIAMEFHGLGEAERRQLRMIV